MASPYGQGWGTACTQRVSLRSSSAHDAALTVTTTQCFRAPRASCNMHTLSLGCGKSVELRREENCSAGGGGDTEAHFPNPPPSLAAMTGGGVQGGGARPAVPGGGGGGNPTSMAQNDTHVALIILTTQMWGGGKLLVEKIFSGQNLCCCAFGANIRSSTKQRARHGTPFLQPPPPSFGGRPCHPPPPPCRAIFRSPWGTACIQRVSLRGSSAHDAALTVTTTQCFRAPRASCNMHTLSRDCGKSVGLIQMWVVMS